MGRTAVDLSTLYDNNRCMEIDLSHIDSCANVKNSARLNLGPRCTFHTACGLPCDGDSHCTEVHRYAMDKSRFNVVQGYPPSGNPVGLGIPTFIGEYRVCGTRLLKEEPEVGTRALGGYFLPANACMKYIDLRTGAFLPPCVMCRGMARLVAADMLDL